MCQLIENSIACACACYILDENRNTTIEGFEANLVLKENASPIFHKACAVPFALTEKFERNLEELVKEGILIPTRSASWASPIVIVRKNDGSVRICLDGKATINKYQTVEHYPLPRIEDILQKNSNWKVFCKIDLTGAYLQVKLSESSQNICTINTHKGLYKYTRMPFGVHSAPAICQAIVDQILMNTNGFAYMDDIIIGGRDEENCKNNLYEIH